MTRQHAAPRHTNRLVSKTSPYLLQHAHNPRTGIPGGRGRPRGSHSRREAMARCGARQGRSTIEPKREVRE